MRSHAFSEGLLHDSPGAGRRSNPPACPWVFHCSATWRPLVARAGYAVGFLIVILGRQQLFAENTLTVILPRCCTKTEQP